MGNKSTTRRKISKLLKLLLFTGSIFIHLPYKTQILRGEIRTVSGESPVSSATINAVGNSESMTITDSTGAYQLTLTPGVYDIYVRHFSYKNLVRKNVVVYSSKHEIQNFGLTERNASFEAVSVTAEAAEKYPLSTYNIQEYAAAFYDPARVATSFASMANVNDQANHLSIRGTSPSYLQWKLEDVEIVSPNHLENSGTINDRPGLNGGGVSMISAQLLGSGSVRLMPVDAFHGNSFSGIFDLKLRPGNNERHQRLFQLSLLGTDLCLEGPFSKTNQSSYLVNFRYSTIGLLSKMGVNFGGELSSYGDFSHVVNLHHKRGTIKIFGFAGNSLTEFNAVSDSADAESEKDLQNFDYHSFTYAQGVSFLTSLTNRSFLKNVVAVSEKNTTRESSPAFVLMDLDPDLLMQKQQKISSLHYFSQRLGNTARLRAGSYANNTTVEITEKNLMNKTSEFFLQPFVAVEFILGKWEFKPGIHAMVIPDLNYLDLQPRLAVIYHPGEKHKIQLSYGHSSQQQPVAYYLSTGKQRPTPGENINYSAQYGYSFKASEFTAEIFFQEYSNVPTEEVTNFSGFNYLSERINFPYIQNGKARSKGIELQYEKKYKGFYILPSLCVYRAEYLLKDRWERARYDGTFNTVLTAGKEWKVKTPQNYISVNFRGFYRGGFREQAVNGANEPYQYQLPDFSRLDFRISYTMNRTRRSSVIALDIQNLSNKKNLAFEYYDHFTRQIEKKYNLGLIPVLSYKVMF